jgi:shikimate 5-dehydrogenase
MDFDKKSESDDKEQYPEAIQRALDTINNLINSIREGIAELISRDRERITQGKEHSTNLLSETPSNPAMAKKVLLLGSGFVATPTVEVLTKAGVHVTVACRTLSSAKKLAGTFPHTSSISLDASDASALEAEVAQHDLTISLIPYPHHAAVIKAAIKARKNVVTTSYVSPVMLELDSAAKEAGITVLNEIGLDPGL